MAGAQVDDALWEGFHTAVNMTSRELREWLATEQVPAARGDDREPEAGDAQWRHRLMSIGHDPLKPTP